jgi:hypothetical protein
MKCALKKILEPLEFVLQKVSSHESESTTTKIGKQIQTEEHKTHEVHEDQIELASKLQHE